MRPVQRGAAPNLALHDYRDAFPSLTRALGMYCSYCERRLETHLAVEHVQPKCAHPKQALNWDNFLLACVNCNSSKGHQDIKPENYLWPDVHNTLLAFSYLNGLVENKFEQTHPAFHQANASIALFGLDKYLGNPDKNRRPSESDRRWLSRQENLHKAQQLKQKLKRRDCVEMREAIIEVALGFGAFSIWFQVFEDDEDMCLRLIDAFLGTAKHLFSKQNSKWIAR